MKSAHDLDNELAKVMGQFKALISEICKRKATASVLNNSGSGSEFKLQIQLGWDFFINVRSGLGRLMHRGWSENGEFIRFFTEHGNGPFTLFGEEVIVFSPIDKNSDVSLFNVAILYTKYISVKGL